MNLNIKLSRKPALPEANIRPTPRPFQLTRTFVETGDERCPIAGIWSRLDCGPITDEPELAPPAMRSPILWRAIHSLLTMHRYSLA
jgi:hypothetical protein